MTLDPERTRRLALIALTLQTAGRIDGRTKLQKITYLTNLYWKCFPDYRYHNFGPFSDTLVNELEQMRDIGWIREDVIPTYNDRTLYAYSIPHGKQGVNNSLIARANDSSLVSRTSSLVKELDKFSSDDLEIMATLVFLRNNDKQLNDSSLVELTHELKPRFDLSRIEKGLRIFKILPSP